MKNIYKISFNDLNIPNADQIFKSIIRISREYDKNFFLIGALARDILLEAIHKRPVQRATLDIDFGVVLSDWHQYEEIMKGLTALAGFKKARESQRLIYNDSLFVDIVPFGNIAMPDDEIKWPPDYSIVMSTLGFEEVYEHAIDVKFTNDISIKVTSLEGLVILKLISWSDRESDKDAVDLRIVLKNYFDINSDEIYKNHFDQIQKEDFDYLKCGARVLGRKLSEIIKTNIRLKTKIIELLDKEILEKDYSKLALAMRLSSSIEEDSEYKTNLELLEELLRGIND
ncbi:nucleotidyl transferase AbiEii/AbiGii toxin family protein [Acidobacteriota bacterium]